MSESHLHPPHAAAKETPHHITALRAWITRDPSGFAAALSRENQRRATELLDGIAAWRASPVSHHAEPTVLWRSGSSRLLDIAPDRAGSRIVLLVPSLINRYYVMDIPAGQGFASMLAKAGWRPIVMDWGEPTEREAEFGLEQYLRERLIDGFQCIAALDPAHRPVLAGYCMGGLLALALAQSVAPERVGGVITLATPWRFATETRPNRPAQARLLGQSCPTTGIASPDWVQALLLADRPFAIIDRYRNLAARLSQSSDTEAPRDWVAIEDWAQHGIGVTFPVLRQILTGWYGSDTTKNQGWRPYVGLDIDPAQLDVACCVAIGEHDGLVAPDMSVPLAEILRDVVLVRAPVSHLGLMVARRAERFVWPRIRHWLDHRTVP